MSFLGIAVNYCMRVNMSVAIVAMVKPGILKHSVSDFKNFLK